MALVVTVACRADVPKIAGIVDRIHALLAAGDNDALDVYETLPRTHGSFLHPLEVSYVRERRSWFVSCMRPDPRPYHLVAVFAPAVGLPNNHAVALNRARIQGKVPLRVSYYETRRLMRRALEAKATIQVADLPGMESVLLENLRILGGFVRA